MAFLLATDAHQPAVWIPRRGRGTHPVILRNQPVNSTNGHEESYLQAVSAANALAHGVACSLFRAECPKKAGHAIRVAFDSPKLGWAVVHGWPLSEPRARTVSDCSM